MNYAFTAGTPLQLVFGGAVRSHRLRVNVAGASDAVIVLDLGHAGPRPAPGANVSLVAGSRIFDSVVHRVDERWTTVRRPALLEVDDQRRTTRSATRLAVSWRIASTPDAPGAPSIAGYVVDLSSRGARLLAEPVAGAIAGVPVSVDVGRHVLQGVIRRVEPHEHASLTYVGVEFTGLRRDEQAHLFRTLGKVRLGEHDWA